MITLERTKDYALVRSIMTHPRIYPHIASDYHPPVNKFNPSESDAIHYLLARNSKGELLGVCIAHPIHTPDTWEVHHCILPKSWRYTSEIGRSFERWIWYETPCQTIVGFTPTCNTLAIRYSVRMGMTLSGVIPAGYRKNGKLYDILMTTKQRPIKR